MDGVKIWLRSITDQARYSSRLECREIVDRNIFSNKVHIDVTVYVYLSLKNGTCVLLKYNYIKYNNFSFAQYNV